MPSTSVLVPAPLLDREATVPVAAVTLTAAVVPVAGVSDRPTVAKADPRAVVDAAVTVPWTTVTPPVYVLLGPDRVSAPEPSLVIPPSTSPVAAGSLCLIASGTVRLKLLVLKIAPPPPATSLTVMPVEGVKFVFTVGSIRSLSDCAMASVAPPKLMEPTLDPLSVPNP